MAYAHYDRLTALDTTFLDLETPNVHMHVGSVGIFEGGALVDRGGLDFGRIIEISEADLRRAPRFRQKLTRVPVSGHPVWVDDEHFNLTYHVRHACLPSPGDEEALKLLVARVMSQKLDRSKPLWELWFVEGLREDRFAVISKVHHCLIDGISGVDLLSAFMGPNENFRAARGEHLWLPRPQPSGLRLLADEVMRRATLPARVAREVASALSRPQQALDAATHAGSGLLQTLVSAVTAASETPFNVEIGPHRRFEWTRFDLGVVREVKAKVGGTINDVALAVVTDAVREYLAAHGVGVEGIDVRALVPVSTRRPQERGRLGNRISLLVAGLPVGEPDPRRRMQRIIEETNRLKHSDQISGANLLEEIGDWTVTGVLTQMSRLAAARHAYNLVVTNIPGPHFPVYLEGARLLRCYPLVPLFANQALGIALFSYDGGLHWGFNADWDALEDLRDFVQLVDRGFEMLRKL